MQDGGEVVANGGPLGVANERTPEVVTTNPDNRDNSRNSFPVCGRNWPL